jgi:hypothetical protein
VVKASQAVSGEIVLENLTRTLMVIAVEHAGAERGLLVLPRGDQLWVEAEATTGLNTVEVNLRQALVTSSELPDSVLQYVVRTQEPVILDDASKEKLFSGGSLHPSEARPIGSLSTPINGHTQSPSARLNRAKGGHRDNRSSSVVRSRRCRAADDASSTMLSTLAFLRLMIISAFVACCCLTMGHLRLAVPSLRSIRLRT